MAGKLTTPAQRAGERRKAVLERELAQWRRDRDQRKRFA